MRKLLLVLWLWCGAALANPALHGTWSVAVNGQPLVVTFNADGSGTINGAPMRWQTMLRLLFVQPQGGEVVTYSFGAQGDKLSEAIFDFERTTGVVATITSESGSKSAQLGQALKDGKKIIVCTIQTFRSRCRPCRRRRPQKASALRSSPMKPTARRRARPRPS